ncbi:hypothetical protein ACF06X_33725 [Streptomyces sp. NPDC015346]|uniref:hypothetical protein n=1 Tax=Streptomyces sp. NPDC015346 TaxID=3364954 RepID=UPI0036FDAFCC
MVNYRLHWTENGERRTSAVSYGLSSAEHRKQQLETAGATDVEIVKVKPGE